MPTGYTAPVVDGEITELRPFALMCARGMGALIMMRDEPHDAPIPKAFQPSTAYHDEALVNARADLSEIGAMSAADCTARALAEHDAAVAAYEERGVRREMERARYDAMIEKVRAWNTEAEGIREFMLDQLQCGRDFDCGGKRYDTLPEAPLSGAEWRAANLERAAKSIGYHEEEIAKEIARTASRNRWLTALRDSLPDTPSDVLSSLQGGM